MRRLLAALLTALFALGFAVPASAQTSPPSPPTDQRVTFGVRPATAQAPDQRSAFTYTATPGARLTDYLAVSNVAESPVNLRVYANDAFNTPEGGFDLLASGGKSVDVGAWTVAGKESVTVPPRSVLIVPFTMTIPANATPGDHAGGIVAALNTEQTAANGQKVSVEQRVGARIYLRIAGPLHPELSITDLSADYHGTLFGRGEATVSYTVRNTGNTRLGGTQWAKVSTPWGAAKDSPELPKLAELLPGGSMRFTTTVSGLLPAGWLTATVHVDPVTVRELHDPAPPSAEASVTTSAIPWPYLVLLLALIALFVVWRLIRRRRKPAAETEKAEAHAPVA